MRKNTKTGSDVAAGNATSISTNLQIRKYAVNKLRQSYGTTIIHSFYLTATAVSIVFIEYLLYTALGRTGYSNYNPLSLDYYLSAFSHVFFLLVRIAVYSFMLIPQMYRFRRSILENDRERFYSPDTSCPTALYINKHFSRTILPAIKTAWGVAFMRLIVFSPITVSIYGICHFARIGFRGEITMFGLVCFMLAIGFTIVWAGVSIHYAMSLSLVKYISMLNPRANFFDSCDLSVKLMEGKHYRLMSLYVTFLPLILLLPFCYPLIALIPYVVACDMRLAKEIMGDFWQDKLPAMTKRWTRMLH
jgi:hypothetical protein